MDQLTSDVQEALEKIQNKLKSGENLCHEDMETLLILNLLREEGL